MTELQVANIEPFSTSLQVANIEPFSTSALAAVPPQRRYPDRPPLMVKGTLVVVAVDVDFVVIQ